jgi:hypothetical protein
VRQRKQLVLRRHRAGKPFEVIVKISKSPRFDGDGGLGDAHGFAAFQALLASLGRL